MRKFTIIFALITLMSAQSAFAAAVAVTCAHPGDKYKSKQEQSVKKKVAKDKYTKKVKSKKDSSQADNFLN